MSRIKLTSVGWNVNWTDVSRADNPSESRDNPSRRHNALARWVGLLGRRSCVCVVFESFVLWILTDWAFSSSLKVSVTVMWVGQKCWHRSLLQEMTEWRAQNGSTSTFENSCCGYTALGTLEFPHPHRPSVSPFNNTPLRTPKTSVMITLIFDITGRRIAAFTYAHAWRPM